MSFGMQKLRSLLSGQNSNSKAASAAAAQRHSIVLEPEIGFQITIESQSHATSSLAADNESDNGNGNGLTRTTAPELNVHLIAARHLPALFGFKIVQGYLIKVKLFPGSKRLDSSIQTNSWPKFNENFKFPLAPDIKPSLKHTARHSNRSHSSQMNETFEPDDLFAGQFVVFTVYALLELPPASFNRLNKTYRSLRDKSTNFVQKVIDSSTSVGSGAAKEETDSNGNGNNAALNENNKKSKKKKSENPRDAMPPLTISESRRNIGSVTCYLEPKLFKRNQRTGVYATEELWLPVKDITTTVATKGPTNNNNLTNSPKGVVELAIELRDLSETIQPATPMPTPNSALVANDSPPDFTSISTQSTVSNSNNGGNIKWQRMTSEVKRKMGISNVTASHKRNLVLRVTTSRMRCSNKVKDELEATAGSVYVKTTVFEHGIYIDAWKSSNFYPSLSTKWDVGEAGTMEIPLQNLDSLENILIRTTIATKTKMGKKLVLGTVMVGTAAPVGTGTEQMQLLREAAFNERVSLWHQFQ